MKPSSPLSPNHRTPAIRRANASFAASLSISAALALPLLPLPLAACATAPPPSAILSVSSPTPAELYLDDRFAGAASGRPLALRPGPHRVEVRAAGMLPAYREVTLAPRERAKLTVTLRPDLDLEDAATGSAR